MIDYIIKREKTEFDDNLDLGRVQVRLFGIIRYLYKTYLLVLEILLCKIFLEQRQSCIVNEINLLPNRLQNTHSL